MRKLCAMIAALGLMMNGCAWLGFGDDDSTSEAVAQETMAAPAQEPQAPAASTKRETATAKKPATSRARGAKSEAQIKAELDKKAQALVAQAARTRVPNAAHKEVTKSGNGWVATYISIDTNSVSTVLRPGANGQYVGSIRYPERVMECRGATREQALSAPCQQVKVRRMNELIRYDGNAWLN